MDNWTAFVGARLVDRERKVRELLRTAQDTSLMLKDPKLLGRVIPGWHSWPDVEAMCEWELRDIVAKREIVAYYDLNQTAEGNSEATAALEVVMQHLAAAWSDHPDYRQEWAP